MTVNGSLMIAGSRDVDRETARTLFEQHLSPFVSQGGTWLVGTARGIDRWAMEWRDGYWKIAKSFGAPSVEQLALTSGSPVRVLLGSSPFEHNKLKPSARFN